MAELTDPAALAALKAYDDASRELSSLQDNLPDADEEGAVDAWVTKAQIQWQLAAKNWEAAEVTDRAWRRVERTFMKILPEVREKSLRTAFVEYNELAERAMQFDFDVVPLPIPKSLKQRGASSSQRAGSHVATSPASSRNKSLVPPPNLARQATPASQTPKPPVLPAIPPRQVSPTPVSPKPASPPTTPPQTKPSSVTPSSPKRAVPSRTSDLAMEIPRLDFSAASPPSTSAIPHEKILISLPCEPTPSRTRSPSLSTTKATMGASSSFPPKPSAGPSFLGLRETDVGFGGAASLHFDSTAFQRPGWGSPAWSPAPTSDDETPSPSRSSFGLSFGPAALLPSPSQFKKTSSTMSIQPSTSSLLTVDAATRSRVIPGPDPARLEGTVLPHFSSCKPLFYPGTDDEEEQSRGVMVDEERVEDSEDEDNVVPGQEDNAPTPPLNDPIDVDREPTQQSDEAPSPPPTKSRRQHHRISFVFNDVTGDFEDPHPTIFLPRPRARSPQDQAPRHSTRPHVSPVDQDAAYLKTTQGSKPSKVKKDQKHRAESSGTKDSKGKEKELAHRKRARDEDDGASAIDKPAVKKLKSKDVKADEAEVVRATPAIRKRGPAPSKPPPVTLGISGGGFGEKVPTSAKPIKNGLKSIGVLVVEEDYGKFVKVDGRYWNKDVAPFVREQYTEPCDTCRRRGTHCRKLLTHTVICARCHYAKQPCEVDGEVALNPVSHYRPKGYKAINTFESALNAIEVNNAAVTSLVQQFLTGLNVLSHTESIHVQSSRLQRVS
ncbi:hypothetical protein EV421DRAFT_1913035 [Armillaria borealis]|uniref:Uncharacterized protein n=1 Tax=Armillaria borealis TaxID=47425 RepID=A0AA39IUW9_9AGAR|nr:hypothetical protein EV421DRAFT_1913035 [Armillaria borealis]